MEYPGIKRAALEIVYDNGGFHHHYSSETQMVRCLEKYLAKQPIGHDQLKEIDTWLLQLSPADINTVCAGEETEMKAALATGPVFTNDLLNGIFEEME